MSTRLSEWWWNYYRAPVGGPFCNVSTRYMLFLAIAVYAAHC